MAQGQLFTRDFLEIGIREQAAYRAIDDAALHQFEIEARRLLDKLRPDRGMNEANTEDKIIKPVVTALGWGSDYLAQMAAARKGRSDVPDILLFASGDKRVLAEKERDRAYEHGLTIVESKAWCRALDRQDGRADDGVPSTQILRYLTRVEILSNRNILWGMLTNGRHWRLYWQLARSRSEQFLELDLPAILGIEGFGDDLFAPKAADRTHWLKVFILVFGRDSFLAASDGRTFHQMAVDEGKLWEERIAKNMSELVFDDVFPRLVEAIHQADPDRPAEPSTAYLQEVRQGALILLYRLLFVLYAEDRNLLPVRDKRYDDYGMRKRIREDIRDRKDHGDTFADDRGDYYSLLQKLFRSIAKGSPSLGLPPYNGGLFDEPAKSILARIELPDSVTSEVVDALSRPKGKWVNYRDLSVQQLGSIYERLLEHEVTFTGGRVQVVANDAARRGSGSYYTPEELVRLIIERTVGPMLQERSAAFTAKLAALTADKRAWTEKLKDLTRLDPAAAFIDLKVCDPAMGSGHFLVSLVDYLADAVLQAMSDAEAEVHDVDSKALYESPLADQIAQIRAHIMEQATANRWHIGDDQLDDRLVVRRMILKRVIFGVDKNPMAVELAKVALWLHTFTVGAPLSFLDHHLRCGDSLLGAQVSPTMHWLKDRGTLYINRYVTSAERAAGTMAEIESITDTDIAEVKESARKFADFSEATAPLTALLDYIQATKTLGVLAKAPNKPPRPIDELTAAKASERIVAKAKADWPLWLRAATFWDILDGKFGDPVAVIRGQTAPPALSDPDQQSLLPTPTPDQPTMFGRQEVLERDRRLMTELMSDVQGLLNDHPFLHWEAAFPNVWSNWVSSVPSGGFDAVIGNPPYVRQEMLGEIKGALKDAYKTFDGMADLYVYFYELALRLLRPGGRLSYVVTNKWLKAGYAEALRDMFATDSWVELVVDFGHAKSFFPDADVFPCVIVARKPNDATPPDDALACIIPRDEVRLEGLSKQLDKLAFTVRRNRLDKDAWSLESPDVQRLLDKIRNARPGLTEYAGVKPYRGVLTGFNEAFLIDTPTRDALVASDPACADVIKPYLRGQDIQRWHSSWEGLWMIFTRRGIDIEKYPSLLAHLEKYRIGLQPKPTDWAPSGGQTEWPGRKSGSYKWFEIQDSVEYWEMFLRPCILYQEIQFYPAYSLSPGGAMGNNKTFMIPTSDRYLLAALNSPLMWWHNWRYLPHMKDEALTPMGFLMEGLPIATVADQVKGRVEKLVNAAVSLAESLTVTLSTLNDWYRHALDIEKPGQALANPTDLSPDEFIAAIKKAGGKKSTLSTAAIKAIKEEHTRLIKPAQGHRTEIAIIERELGDLVNQAYGLTQEDVKLMWDTAPPRMPVAAKPDWLK